ncbi:class I SAM-dependent methyltransferase [Nocardia sp. NPDC058658]|uniref:class I SAM-dependent methyltransferase n=1 Tax=Nocardia sp. NPDC058658 TaxID=3346580 RepID=UPI0036621C1C
MSTIDATNTDQAHAWDGDEGAHWATHSEIVEESLARYRPAFLRAAAIEPTYRVLDIGCGTGATTRAAAEVAHAGSVFGVDLSARMIEVARGLARQAGLTNVAFDRADAQVHPFETEAYDVVISQTGAMFFGRPETAFANLRRSLTPGGRLVLLTWQPPDRQEWIGAFSQALTGRTPPVPASDVPGPFSLSDPDHVRKLLHGAGFDHVELTSSTETTTYGRTVEEAHTFLLGLLGWMVEGQEPAQRAYSIAALRDTLAAHQTDDGVRFGSATWLVTATRA